jgi:hypothetical protein
MLTRFLLGGILKYWIFPNFCRIAPPKKHMTKVIPKKTSNVMVNEGYNPDQPRE